MNKLALTLNERATREASLKLYREQVEKHPEKAENFAPAIAMLEAELGIERPKPAGPVSLPKVVSVSRPKKPASASIRLDLPSLPPGLLILLAVFLAPVGIRLFADTRKPKEVPAGSEPGTSPPAVRPIVQTPSKLEKLGEWLPE